MSSFEVLSWGSLKKLSQFTVERDSFDLVLKLSEDSDSFRVTLSQLEKAFKYLTKFSCNFLEPLIFKCSLLLLRFLLASIGLWLMNWIFTSLHKFNKTLFTSLTFLLHWSFRVTILETVNWRLSFVTFFAKATIDWPIPCGFFSGGTSFVSTGLLWNTKLCQMENWYFEGLLRMNKK